MAYHFDNTDNSLVIDGFENGIADTPYAGIANMRNININSIPGEASVNFKTASVTPPIISDVSVVSADASTDIITISSTPNIETRMCVTFSGSSLPGGITAGTIYWVSRLSDTTIKIYSAYAMSSAVDITSSGTGTMDTINMGIMKCAAYDKKMGYNYFLDSNGRVWTDGHLTGTNSYWTYVGNLPNNNSNGNGIVYYEASDETGYLFVFSNSSIDVGVSGNYIVFSYQWDPSAGTYGAYSSSPTPIMKTGRGSDYSHEAFVGPDNSVYVCDKNWIFRFYEKNPATPFSPITSSTYVYDNTRLLPVTDRANCLSYLGSNVIVGGINNTIYQWDPTSVTYDIPITISESYISHLVTVNTNTYVFAGNRGRIYILNGSQAQTYKKIPDHISGTVEPYFNWGGACCIKNQLFFGLYCTANNNSEIGGYGGVWSIDLDTGALRMSNVLSHGLYTGYATLLVPVYDNSYTSSGNPVGIGYIAGWRDNLASDNYGIDKTIFTPYTSGEATIETDLINIGTYNAPRNWGGQVEFKLSSPLVSGESISMKYRTNFKQSYTTIFTENATGSISGGYPTPIENSQWIQFQIILTSTASNPSYVRLKEIRITGMKGESVMSAETF